MDRTYIFGEPSGGAGSGNGLLASILPSLQNRGIDTGYLMGLMGGNGNGGFFGNNGGFQDIIALIVIAAIFGNGNFGFGGNNNQGANEGREMIMQTLNRNGVDIAALAQAVNTSSDQILAGINSVSQAICGLGNQMGQNTNSILTAIMQGNNALTSQICSCCCDMKQLVTTQGYENQLAMCNQINTLRQDNVSSYLFCLGDTKEEREKQTGKSFRSLAIINDSVQPSNKLIEALNKYGTNVLLWKDKNKEIFNVA